MSPSARLTPGQRFGPYQLLDELGRGGMGVVYRALHEGLGRDVALKLITGDAADPRRQQRFRLEAQGVARLSHPSIVAIHDAGEHAGHPYLVMDLVEGPSLEQRLREGPLEPDHAAQLTLQLAEALDHAHEQQLLHRDVKPANVLLRADGTPVLVDFGLAKLVDAGGPTRTGHAMGTPAYSPPEQLVGDPLDWSADVYGLGATFYAMLCGEAPFNAETILELMSRVASDEPLPPSRREPGVDRDLETICLKCLEKDPRDRYPTARALADDLRRALANEPIAARRAGAGERLAKWARRNPTGARGAALALVTTLATSMGIVVWRARDALDRAEARREAAAREAAAGDDARQVALAEREQEVRAAAEQAWGQLQAAEAASPERRLGLALQALQTAQRWRDLSDDAVARASLFDASLALAEVAAATEQWTLAEQTLEQALALGVDDALATARLDAARTARDAEATERRDVVTHTLAWVRSGEARAIEGGLVEAVFRITRYPHPQTVTLLAAELDRVSRRLIAIQRQLLLEVAEPDAAERARGEQAIPELAQALGDYERKVFGDARTPAPALGPIEQATRRWLIRGGHDPVAVERGQFTSHPMAQAIDSALSPGDADTIRVVAEALGRIGIEADAVQALGRYLPLECSASRAAVAGIALARLNTERSLTLLDWAFSRFGSQSFGLRVQQFQGSLGRRDTRTAQAEAGNAPDHAKRGQRNYVLGRLAEAAEDYGRALALDPDNPAYLSNRASMLQQLGRLAEAEVDLQRALELDPGNATAWNNLGRLRLDAGQLQEADAAFTRTIELDPTILIGWTNRAACRRQQGRLREALADHDRALSLSPADPDHLFDRGLTYAMAGDLDAARADWDRALELDPTHMPARTNRGKVRREQGDLEGSLEDLSRALEQDPTNAWAWAQRGRVRTELDDRGALADLRQALELAPRSFDTHTFLGIYHARFHEYPLAIEAFQAALRLEPQNPQASAVRSSIAQVRAAQGR